MGGNIFLEACNRQDIKAQAVLFQCIVKGARFRFPTDQGFFDPCRYAACLIRLGSERANIWCMATVSPGASLPLSGSTVVLIFLLWPGRLGGMCSVIFAERADPLGYGIVTREVSLFGWRVALK